MSFQDTLEQLQIESQRSIEQAKTLKELEELRVIFIGKKGKLTRILQQLGKLPPDERPVIGQLANELRQAIKEKIVSRQKQLETAERERRLREEAIDITLPGKRPLIAQKHILTQIIEEITLIFIGLGYEIVEGPEVELDYYNFEGLNTPPDHPARSLQDTFYVEPLVQPTKESEQVLLRTHTSPVQVRVMESRQPPLFVISPGKTYRRDVADATHSPMFNQVEGFAVDKRITFGDLKGTLDAFVKAMFGEERNTRFRPHFFPFTEPSAEVDVSCFACSGKGCRICKQSGWIEILGAGMIDPNVFEMVGYDPEKITGFAFGMGVERIAMLKYGINDMRAFFENDLRLLRQF